MDIQQGRLHISTRTFKHVTNCVGLIEPTDVDPLVAFNLAFVYFEQGRWKRAEVYGVVVMEKRSRC
jgi:hypothetical protein